MALSDGSRPLRNADEAETSPASAFPSDALRAKAMAWRQALWETTGTAQSEICAKQASLPSFRGGFFVPCWGQAPHE